MSVVIQMDAADFRRLVKTYADRTVTQVTAGRFDTGHGGAVNAAWDWRMAYWLGRDYAAVILARAFLAAYGYMHEVLWDAGEDEDEPPPGWCVSTCVMAGSSPRFSNKAVTSPVWPLWLPRVISTVIPTLIFAVMASPGWWAGAKGSVAASVRRRCGGYRMLC